MCDYSLYTVANRLANEGEELVLHRFGTGSMGFASVEDVQAEAPKNSRTRRLCAALKEWMFPRKVCGIPAVCIPPGAHLLLTNVPAEVQTKFHMEDPEVVVFTELSNREFWYRDAVALPNSYPVLLQHLPEGICATVLSLTAREQELETDEELVPVLSAQHEANRFHFQAR